MPGANQLGRLGLGVENGVDGAGSLLGADACVARDVVDRHCIRRAVGRRVVVYHRVELKPFGKLGQNRHAQQPLAVRDHEFDNLGSDLLRGDHEIALVLSIFGIDDNDDAAIGESLERVFDRGVRV